MMSLAGPYPSFFSVNVVLLVILLLVILGIKKIL